MFAKLTVVLSTLAIFASAAPGAPTPGLTVSQCNTGNAQCCNQVYQTGSQEATQILNHLVDVVTGDLTGELGFQCTPITGLGISVPKNCVQKAVCCHGQTARGAVNIDCSPISL